MSDENSELKAKIAALAGQINRHKQHTAPGYHHPYASPSSPSFPRARINKTRAPAYRNRSLVLTSAQPGGLETAAAGESHGSLSDNSNGSQAWVSKRDRHMQLINASVYDQRTQQRSKEIDETMKRRRDLRDRKDKASLQSYFNGTPGVPGGLGDGKQVLVDGLGFTFFDGGNKLIRVPGILNNAIVSHDGLTSTGAYPHVPTPKTANVAGVTYLRSKNGNLIRAGLMNQPYVSGMSNQAVTNRDSSTHNPVKSGKLCPRFTSTGSLIPFQSASFQHVMIQIHRICAHGSRCHDIHDASKVAICKTFLHKGECPEGDACDLSHEPTAHRVPLCVHFLRGNCSNQNCPYSHVKPAPGAPVCRPFATIGYCEKGAECPERHVHECPDYANTGTCSNPRCRLPHPDRAGQIRKAAAAASSSNASTDTPRSSDSDDDVDSDGVTEDLTMFDVGDGTGQEMRQQQDYIPV
ncbi:hypothetical protein P152DRAFT_433761 [Eremomyces bilateralis CBS 781.70]|uniref:C3H1-type domain-containing protein n=1 Tax=Eremomyces bilateralis CBS 781.70 TaxID=1392243 RepID=A0A6G1G803_9PEZI|nr:uncharacterized protein P152DRAFT_433761 [Eremomyces bilateralis CBS 781.70]KAF1814051.1 hypothetical protein P152DRAFT_433761 [Eremomyces bilateralis CBS 781.70]